MTTLTLKAGATFHIRRNGGTTADSANPPPATQSRAPTTVSIIVLLPGRF